MGGLATTIIVMNVFEAAQPALLYIVPAVLGAVSLHALILGEAKQVINSSLGSFHLMMDVLLLFSLQAPLKQVC